MITLWVKINHQKWQRGSGFKSLEETFLFIETLLLDHWSWIIPRQHMFRCYWCNHTVATWQVQKRACCTWPGGFSVHTFDILTMPSGNVSDVTVCGQISTRYSGLLECVSLSEEGLQSGARGRRVSRGTTWMSKRPDLTWSASHFNLRFHTHYTQSKPE